MSKIVSDLHNLEQARKKTGGIVIEDPAPEQAPKPALAEPKGQWIMSALLVLLIALSAFSTSVSLKTHAQLESTWGDAKAIMAKLDKQDKDIEGLSQAMADNASAELDRIVELNEKIAAIKAAAEDHGDEIGRLKAKVDRNQTAIEDMIDGLKKADEEMLKKFSLLNDKVNDSLKYSSTYLSTY